MSLSLINIINPNPMIPMPLRALLLCLICVCPVTAKPKDLTLIHQLPQRLVAMKKEGHKKWDTGITSTMREGTAEFNHELVGILKELIRTHATKTYLKESEVDAYVEALVLKLKFEMKLENPRGEDRGTLAGFYVPCSLSVELREAVVLLVQGIAEDDESFDFDAWHKAWERAMRTGDY